jgi:hypothetical protein
MTLTKIFGFIALAFFIICAGLIFLFIKACNDGELFQAGSGLGSVTRIEKYKFKGNFYEKFSDSLFKKFPEYKVPKDDPSFYMTQGYEFLRMTKFYFDKSPKEIYCVQWEQGIDVRMAYNVDSNKTIIENYRNKQIIEKSDKERMKKRLKIEIIDKLDSLIENSTDRDSALLKIKY